MASVLAAGDGAVLSHRSAAELWGLFAGARLPTHVTVARARRPQKRIRFHRSLLPFDEITRSNGIPTTTVPRTILDHAATETTRQVERMINEADVQQLWDRLSLDDLLERNPNRAGSAAVRQALRRRREGASVTKSELEEMLIELLDELGLPRPRVNQSLSVDGILYEPDCLWPEHGLVIELDSRRFHHTEQGFESDANVTGACCWPAGEPFG